MIRCTAVLAAFLLLGSAWQDADLSWKRAAGDTTRITLKSELKAKVTTKDSEGTKERPIDVKATCDYGQDIRTVANGRATSIQVRCNKSTQQIGVKEEPTALNGRSFEIKRGSPTQSVTAIDNGEVPADAFSLGGWEDAAHLLPGKATSVGSRWKVEAAKIVGVVSIVNMKESKGELDVRFESMEGDNATVSFSGAIQGKTNDGFDADVNIDSGTLVMDTKNSRPVSMKLSGSFKMVRRVTRTRRVRKLDDTGNPESHDDGTPVFVDIEDVIGVITVETEKLTVELGFK